MEYKRIGEEKLTLVIDEIGLSGTNGKAKQAVGYKTVSINSGHFEHVEAGLTYVLCDMPVNTNEHLDFRLLIHGIPDAIIKRVEYGLAPGGYYKVLEKGMRSFGKKHLSRGKQLYELLTMDGEQINCVGDKHFTNAQGKALEIVGRELIAQYLPKCAEPVDLLKYPYQLSIKPDLAILFYLEGGLGELYELMADAWCFSLQRNL